MFKRFSYKKVMWNWAAWGGTRCGAQVWRSPSVMGNRFLSRALAGAAVFGLLGGCAINTMGTLASRVTPADSAVVIDLYTLGAHLRTRAEDPGLTVGLARRSYVFAVQDAGNISPGWHFLRAPLPPVAAVAQHAASLEARS